MHKLIIAAIFLSPGAIGAQPVIKEPGSETGYQAIIGALLNRDKTGDKRVAVADFSYSDRRDSLDGTVISERLTTELVKAKKAVVIERKETEKVFKELKLQYSGAVSSDSAKELGRLLGADWLMVGTLTDLPDSRVEVNARIINVESGEILAATTKSLERDWLSEYNGREILNQISG